MEIKELETTIQEMLVSCADDDKKLETLRKLLLEASLKSAEKKAHPGSGDIIFISHVKIFRRSIARLIEMNPPGEYLVEVVKEVEKVEHRGPIWPGFASVFINGGGNIPKGEYGRKDLNYLSDVLKISSHDLKSLYGKKKR